jgi:hypothetical protein
MLPSVPKKDNHVAGALPTMHITPTSSHRRQKRSICNKGDKTSEHHWRTRSNRPSYSAAMSPGHSLRRWAWCKRRTWNIAILPPISFARQRLSSPGLSFYLPSTVHSRESLVMLVCARFLHPQPPLATYHHCVHLPCAPISGHHSKEPQPHRLFSSRRLPNAPTRHHAVPRSERAQHCHYSTW